MITAGVILGISLKKKHKTNIVEPRTDDILKSPNLRRHIKPDNETISSYTKDNKFAINKINYQGVNQNPFDNRNLIYHELEDDRTLNILWVTKEDEENTQLKNQIMSVYDSLINRTKKLSNEWYKQNEIIETRSFVRKNYRIIKNGIEELFNNIKKFTNDMIYNKTFLYARYVNNDDTKTSAELKDQVTAFVFMLHKFVQDFYETLKLGNIHNYSVNKYLEYNEYNLSTLGTKFSSYKNRVKELLTFLEKLIITVNNYEQVLKDIDNKLLELDTYTSDINAYISTFLELPSYNVIEVEWDNQVQNLDRLLEQSTYQRNTLWYSLKSKLISTLTSDIEIINEYKHNAIYQDATLRLLRLKYNRFNNQVNDLLELIKRDKNYKNESYTKILNVLENYVENSKKISEINTEYKRNIVINYIVNVRYLIEKIGNIVSNDTNAIEKFNSEMKELILGKFLPIFKQNMDKHMEWQSQLSNAKSSIDVLKRKYNNTSTYFSELQSLHSVYQKSTNYIPNKSEEIMSQIDQYKVYNQRLKSQIERLQSIVTNAEKHINEFGFEEKDRDANYYIDSWEEYQIDDFNGDITQILDMIFKLPIDNITNLNWELKNEMNISDTEINEVISKYNELIKTKLRATGELINYTFNLTSSMKNEFNEIKQKWVEYMNKTKEFSYMIENYDQYITLKKQIDSIRSHASFYKQNGLPFQNISTAQNKNSLTTKYVNYLNYKADFYEKNIKEWYDLNLSYKTPDLTVEQYRNSMIDFITTYVSKLTKWKNK
ncbi:hypothetical protein SAM46_00965 [Mycoplasmopsis verecunda]|uniref:hypothetical protein n=2 Tax=Mycoplasmopsis verecunda TaxID=171291 RepID=UPI00298C76AE|nr:hypothetical protein [Mycoplasmopsis verecunda]WPB54714.1 hypothetical protein SAM46_00965 [Mycoplasmopsis verecunda]